MNCKNCIAHGSDFISSLCVAKHTIIDFKDGQGCLNRKETIEKDLKAELVKKPEGYYQLKRKEFLE
jgi:hypothetical protein